MEIFNLIDEKVMEKEDFLCKFDILPNKSEAF